MLAGCRFAPESPVRGSLIGLGAILALLVTGHRTGEAQDTPAVDSAFPNEPNVPEKRGKNLLARRVAQPGIVVDGRLDEETWSQADSISDLVQLEPDNMAPSTERTVVRVLYDDRYIYVGIIAFDSDPRRIATGLVRRDYLPPADLLSVGFDPRHDHLTGYGFTTSPKGVQRDQFFYDDMARDPGYDAVWEVGTRVTDSGWTAEFRIPFAQMRFTLPASERMVWGFDVRRDIFRKGEGAVWIPTPRGARGVVSRWGHLIFADGLPTPRRLELLPFTLGRRSQFPGGPAADHTFSGGVDARIGLGPATTLAATINPDFGQVELDPAVLNLTVFETFFPERRPFFTEDSRVFVPPYELFQLFHSRRIGQAPRRFDWLATDDTLAVPTQTTIIGAGKLTGKSAGWTWGLLTAATGREHALVNAITVTGSDTSRTRQSRLLEPLTSYTAARVQRDILGGTSNIGVLATAVLREAEADAVTGGVDYKIRWGSNLWQWDGHWAATSAPDTGRVLPGTDRPVRTGFGGITTLGYTGKHFGFQTTFDHLGPDFRVNDLGFLNSRVDRTGVHGTVQLRQPDPRGPFRRVSAFARAGQAWNGDRLVFERTAELGGTAVFRNFSSLSLGVLRGFETLDDLDTRGGPPIVRPARAGASLSFGTDSRRTTQLAVNLAGQTDEADGWNARLGSSLGFQLWPALQASVSATYGFGVEPAQHIRTADVDQDAEVDYVYGTLRRDVLDITLRSTYALHRDLTFQLFLQPFVAVGDFGDIRKLARPRSFEFEPVTIPFNPDFNRKSLRGTAVLRWEYLRGSTLYVAWSLATRDPGRPGTFEPWHDLRDAFRAEGVHQFLVKLSYWWSP